MYGTYWIDCESTANLLDKDTNKIRYIDPVSEEEVTTEVPFEDLKYEMTDLYENVMEFSELNGVTFNPPVLVGWCKKIGIDPYWIEYWYDFGMIDMVNVPEDARSLGLVEDSTDEEIIKAWVTFDLEHAFCHIKEDPNYSHTHWALYGNLKNRATLTEKH